MTSFLRSDQVCDAHTHFDLVRENKDWLHSWIRFLMLPCCWLLSNAVPAAGLKAADLIAAGQYKNKF